VERFSDKANRVEAEMPLGIGRVKVVQNYWNEPIDVFASAPEHRLELALLPRSSNARGCFPLRWGPYRFEPIGEVFFLPARHTVHAISDCRHQNSIVCDFSPEAVATWFEGELEWTDGRLRGSLNIVSANIRSLLYKIGEEICNPGFASQTMVELLAGQAALELSRHLLGIGQTRQIGGLSPWQFKQIEARLKADGKPPSLNELAALCDLSVRHLTRAFRASRRRSIGSYIAEQRMDQAKRLLGSAMSVKSVAYTIGFTAPSNFTAAFLRSTGETPSQYKQRVSRKTVIASPCPPQTN
jgi:AraC family transcriptional regulator